MAEYNTKNYTEHGGEKTIIGGELIIDGKIIMKEGAQSEGFPPYTIPAATADTLGGVKVGSGLSVESDGTLSADGITPAAAQADSEAEDVEGLVTDFNGLLAKLRAAGFIAANAE